MTVLSLFFLLSFGSCSSSNDSTGTDTPVNPKPSDVKVMDKSKIVDYNQYYCPAKWNEGFEKGPDYMLRSDARWSWWRMKQSEHFFVFWEPGFGDNPNAESVPEALRVDVDDLLQKAEQFYKTNVEKLGMATIGEGKSVLDNYKMQIYLLYQTKWLATGSGYDDKISALWVNPSTCKPVGSTIGHEIGHSFQYQVSADKLFTGEVTPIDRADGSQLVPAGFRYGFGENGAGGCAYWEQCAQWQSFQDYPNECFDQDAHYAVWLKNHHRHFNHEFMRYASYWFQYWFTEKHGIESYARIWKESKYPEDPLQTYMRIYCNNSLDALYKDLYAYSAHCADYDFKAVHQYKKEAAINYSTKLYKNDGYYQVAYTNCPGTTGFNLIPLNVPASGKVSATLEGLAPGSALAAADPGTVVDGDGNAKSTVPSIIHRAILSRIIVMVLWLSPRMVSRIMARCIQARKAQQPTKFLPILSDCTSVYWLLLISIIVMPGMMMRPMMSNGLIV
mgnify:FL=1